jgi:hypothetical protein
VSRGHPSFALKSERVQRATSLRVASFTVQATAAQSARWKRAADNEGFRSAGAWLADAADAYLQLRARQGAPVPLSWHKGRFSVVLVTGKRVHVSGMVSPPFGVYQGTGENLLSWHPRTLVFLPSGRIVATLRTSAQCRTLASELARLWVRWEEGEPMESGAPALKR